MRDMMQQVDNSLLIPVPQHSRHNLDVQTLTTGTFGNLMPIFLQETVPGGSYTIANETLCRFQPLSSPLMHRMTLKTHYFYVPYRLLWDNWENFIMGRKDPITSLDPVHPFYSRQDNLGIGTPTGKVNPILADYFGLKPSSTSGADDFNLSPMCFAAYQLIYNWYYRHKSVKDEVPYKLQDGAVAPLDMTEIYTVLRKITYEDDYFQSALPTPQEGQPIFIDSDAQLLASNPLGLDISLDGGGSVPIIGAEPNPNDNVALDSLFARTRILVEEIRRAAKLQQYVELNNHAKTYIDFLKGHYNVDLQDYRLGIPEYITGFSQPIQVADVTNMSDNHQGRITGNAGSYAASPKETYFAREHGLIIGLAAVTYKSTYIDALPKLHTKTSRFDFFNPLFDNLGEQAIKNIEIQAGHENPDGTFGYVPRHFEYRSSFDMCTGEARNTLAHWHLARGYHEDLHLTEDFYEVLDERRAFVFQDPNYDPIILQVYNNVSAVLPMGEVAHPSL